MNTGWLPSAPRAAAGGLKSALNAASQAVGDEEDLGYVPFRRPTEEEIMRLRSENSMLWNHLGAKAMALQCSASDGSERAV